jgi:hypothetical protein
MGSRRRPRIPRKNSYHRRPRLRPRCLQRPCPVDIPLPSNFQPVSQVLCLDLARPHLVLAAPRVYHRWSAALFQVLMVSVGIRPVWYAAADKQKGVVVGGSTDNLDVASK